MAIRWPHVWLNELHVLTLPELAEMQCVTTAIILQMAPLYYLRAVGRKVLWSSACVCLCVCAHTVTASAQVCVPLGHSIF